VIKNKEKSVIIIPCYNEAENIDKLIPLIFRYEKNADILIVDDSSKDNTKEVIKKLQQKYSNKIFTTNRTGERSFALSYVDGFKWALSKDYDFIFQMDGDFSHHPKYLPVLLEQMKDYDLVIGSRYCAKKISTEDWSSRRLVFSLLANFYARVITGLPVSDVTGGFKCFRRNVLEVINLNKIYSKGFAVQIEINFLVYKLGFKIGEVPIIFYGRKYGESKISFKKIIEGLWIPIKKQIEK